MEEKIERKFIDPLGYDFTEYIVNDEKEKLFYQMCIAQLNSKGPLKETYIYVVQALNLEAEIKGKPKRAFIQGDPKLN